MPISITRLNQMIGYLEERAEDCMYDECGSDREIAAALRELVFIREKEVRIQS